jgi:hypothetical protein
MTGRSEHWNQVYGTKAETDVSWYQPLPHLSLSIINSVASKDSPIIDIGGGASRLVDELLAAGYSDLTVLDVSEAALARSRERLGVLADRVEWIMSDITKWDPPRRWNVWHDRAVFHFLTDPDDQNAYLAALEKATARGASVVISTFALDGPEKCSGLPVQRYSAETLAERLGSGFQLKAQHPERHVTPRGAGQEFVYAVFERA